MHQVTVSRQFDHSARDVWDLLDHFSETWVYHPIVRHSTCLNGIERGEGASRQCEMYNGDKISERVVSHDASAMRYSIEVFDHGPFPTKVMLVDVLVEAIDARSSKATYELTFDMKYGPAGWVMGKLAMRSGMEKMLTQLLDGVGLHLDTGRIVQEDGTPGELLHAA